MNNQLIDLAIESMLPDLLANGLTRKEARILYMAKNKVIETSSGLTRVDRLDQIIPGNIEDHIRAFAESFEKAGRGGKDEVVRAKPGPESLHSGSDVAAYFEKNNTPESEQSGILAKAMKNQGFNINE